MLTSSIFTPTCSNDESHTVQINRVLFLVFKVYIQFVLTTNLSYLELFIFFVDFYSITLPLCFREILTPNKTAVLFQNIIVAQ